MTFTKADREQIKKFLKENQKTLKKLTKPQGKAIPIVDIDTISNNVWLFIRTLLGCGGSEIAGLINLSPYTNAVKIYDNKFPYLYRTPYKDLTDEEIETVIERLEKNNPDKDYSTQFLLDYGHHMEEFIRQQFLAMFEERYKEDFEDKFSEKFGKYMEIVDVDVYKDSTLYRHAKYPMFADFDYRIRIAFADGTKHEGIFECKTASSYHIRSKWENGFPDYYEAQVRNYMEIADVDFFVICCLADNSASNFYAHLGFRDEDKANELVNAAVNFWESVMNETIPAVDENVDALDDLLDAINLEEKTNQNEQQLGLKALALCEKRNSLLDAKFSYNSAIKGIDEQIGKIETQIMLQCMENDSSRFSAENSDVKYSISITERKSSRFDKNGFLKAHPEQKAELDAFTKTSSSKKLKIDRTVKEEQILGIGA